MSRGPDRPAPDRPVRGRREATAAMSGGQRALWTFLMFTLVGPAVAALLAALYTPLAIWANSAPFTAGDHAPFDPTNLPDWRGLTQVMAASALATFVWAPIAAAVAAAGIVVLMVARGTVGAALAGAAGVIGFFVAYMIAPFGAGDLLAAFALAAGFTAAGLARFLIGIGVLPQPD